MTAAAARDQSYSITISVDQAPGEVFDAIVNPRDWWSQNINGRTDAVGEEFTYQYRDAHLCKIRVTELVPGERVTWLVVDNYFNCTEDDGEWKDTEIRFDIGAIGGQTQVSFTHRGLVPDYECFDVCANSWDFYLRASLRALIRTGHGLPDPKQNADTAADGAVAGWR